MRAILSSLSFGSTQFKRGINVRRLLTTREFTDEAVELCMDLKYVYSDNLKEYFSEFLQTALSGSTKLDRDSFNLVPYLCGIRKNSRKQEEKRGRKFKHLITEDEARERNKGEMEINYSFEEKEPSSLKSSYKQEKTGIEIYDDLQIIRQLIDAIKQEDDSFLVLLQQANDNKWDTKTSNQLVEYIDRVRLAGSTELYDNIKDLCIYMIDYKIFDIDNLLSVSLV